MLALWANASWATLGLSQTTNMDMKVTVVCLFVMLACQALETSSHTWFLGFFFLSLVCLDGSHLKILSRTQEGMPIQHRSVCFSISKIQFVWMRQSIIWQVNKFGFFFSFAVILLYNSHSSNTFMVLTWARNLETNTTFKCFKQFQDPQLSHRNVDNKVVRIVCCTTDSGDCHCEDKR